MPIDTTPYKGSDDMKEKKRMPSYNSAQFKWESKRALAEKTVPEALKKTESERGNYRNENEWINRNASPALDREINNFVQNIWKLKAEHAGLKLGYMKAKRGEEGYGEYIDKYPEIWEKRREMMEKMKNIPPEMLS